MPPLQDDDRYETQSEFGEDFADLTYRSVTSGLTYKKLPDTVFFWVAIMLHTSIIMVALIADDVESVFDFVGAIGCSSISFLFPGLGYIVALQKFGTSRIRKRCDTLFNQIVAWTYIAVWILICVLYIYSTCLKASGKLPKDADS